MFGIETVSCAPSGRGDFLTTITQGIAPMRSALGWVLAARWAASLDNFSVATVTI